MAEHGRDKSEVFTNGPVSKIEEDDEEEEKIVERDPTGRYGRCDIILGKGAFKTVFKAFDEVDGIEVAWNQVKVQDVFKSEEDLERLYSEVNLLKTLKHKNIIKFYNSWVDSKTKNVNFITEIFTSGTLRQYRKRHKHCDIKAVKNWSRQILRGLLYLHSHDPPIIHRDLKCDNIFVNGNQGEVKIGDLGLAAILQHKNAAHSVIGTPEFMAPELYEEEYNELVDIYAFGMCVLEMVTFEYPYSECSNAAQIYKKVIAGKKPAALDRVKDPEVRAFVEKCLASASRRLPARELLMDPFLAESDRESVDGANSMSRSESKGEALDSLLKPDDGGNSKPSPERSMRTDSNLSLADSGRCEHASSEMLAPSALLEKLGARGSNEDTPDDAGGPDSADAQHLSRDFKVKGKLAEDDTGTVFLRLKIADSTGHVRNIHFPFSTTEDTAFSVASEMVEELDLTDQDVSTIAEMIDAEILKLVPDWKPGLSLEDDDGDGEGGGHGTEEGGQSPEDLDQEVEDNPASLNTVASDTSLSAHASERDRSASPPRSRSRSHSRTGLKGHGRSFSPPSSGNFVGGFSPPTGDGFGVIHGRFWEGVPGKFADGNVGFSSDDSDGKEETEEGKGDEGSVDQDVSASAAPSDADGDDVVSDNINEFTVHSASGEKRFSSDDMQLITGKWEARGLEREESNNSYGRRSLTDFREVLDMRDKGPFRKISSDEWPGVEGGGRPGSNQPAGDLSEEEADDELQRQLEELERQRQQEMRDLERKYNQKLNEVRNRHRSVRDGSWRSPAGKDQQGADVRDGYQTDPAWDRGGERAPLAYGKLQGYPESSGLRWQEYDEYGGGSSGRRGARGLYAQTRGDSSDRDGSSWKSGELSRERHAEGVWPEPHGGATERYYGDPVREREGLGFGKREDRGRGRGLELGVAAYDGVSGSGPPRERGGWEYRGGRDPVTDRYRGEDRDYRDPRLDREWERDWGRERRGERERVGDRDRMPERERDRIGERERVMERDRIGERERLTDRERSGDRDRVGERDWAAEKERALERHVGPEKDRALEKDRPVDRDRERERERGGDRERDRDKDHRLPERDQKRLAERDVERKPVERERERGGEKERPSERDRVGDRERDRERRPQDKDGATERDRDRLPDRERDRGLERDRDRDRSDRDRERIPERVRIGDRDRDRDWDWERDRDRGRDWGREREWGRDYGRSEWRDGGRVPSRHNLEPWELGPPRGYGRYGRGDEWDRADYDPRYYPGEAHWGGTRGSSGSPQWDEYGSDDGRGPPVSPPRTSSKKGEKGGGAAEELYGVAPHRFDAGHPFPRVRDDARAGRPEVDAGRYWPSMHSYSGPVPDGPPRDEAYPREVSERPRERYDRREIDKESSDGSVGGRGRERRDAVVEPPAMWKDSSWELSHKGLATKPLVTKSGPLLGGGSGDLQDGRGGPVDKRVLKDGDGRKGGPSGESSRRSSHGDEPRMRSGVGKELDAVELRKSVSERILELPELARDSLASSGSRSTSTLNQLPQAIAEDEGSADDSEEDEVEAGRAVPSRELADAMSDRHEETYADAVKSTLPKAAGGGTAVRAEYSAGGQAGTRMLSGDHRDVPLRVVEGHASGANVKREQLQKSIAELEARTLLGLTAAKVPKNGLYSASSAGPTQSGLMALKKGATLLQPPSQQQQQQLQQQQAAAAGGGNHGPPNPSAFSQQLPAPQAAQTKQPPRPNSP